MKYRRKTRPKWVSDSLLILGVCAGFIIGAGWIRLNAWADELHAQQFVHPLADAELIVYEKEVPAENIDTWIREAAAKYANTSYPESYLKYQLHCLANKESGHRYNQHTKCGDGGKSCGLYQYRDGTWNGFRKIMISEGLAEEIGSKWDDELQINTTAWALSEGRHQNWGPWLRGECR